MATEPTPLRTYRAACPNCGAPVEFRSATTPFAVCSFCRSTVVRAGDGLRKIGESAEVFDDHSPVQLGATGTYQGARFSVVGRLQYRYADGTWNEWHALFESGPELVKSGWLSEDNGRYVIAFDAPLRTAVPPPERLAPGAPLTVNDERWTVASVTAARLIAAQGELPRRPDLTRGFVVADLRSSRDDVGTLDYTDPQRPAWSVGRPVQLAALAMTGLAEDAGKTIGGRAFACPQCAAAVTIVLDTTQSIVCGNCKSVIDVSHGIGADVAHFRQRIAREPEIALGSVGTLTLGPEGPLPWQVVGFVERREIPEDEEDDPSSWREYLLYHRTAGFAFLVDAEDGWSSAVPITGAPEGSGDTVQWQGTAYRKLYDYTGEVVFVLGEFYWKLERNQKTRNSDYQGTGAAAAKKLNRERTTSEGVEEVVWSAGEAMQADAVAAAFKLTGAARASIKRGAASGKSISLMTIFWVVVFGIMIWAQSCSDRRRPDCDSVRNTFGEASQEYQSCLGDRRSGGGLRSGGGAFGGFSSGGGHK